MCVDLGAEADDALQKLWYSTQTTVSVLDALMSVLRRNETPSKDSGSQAEIVVNGKSAAQLSIPSSAQIGDPMSIDISKYLTAGTNRVEIRRATGSTQASAQLIESHYEKWSEQPNVEKQIGGLKLQVVFDKTNAQIGDEITCAVRAERVGFRGYGMLLAEIGLPPGADVDRGSLDRAEKENKENIDSYDILPDRLVVYLWPQAGGTSFNFKLRPRFGLKASAAASSIYDYCNPEARAVIAPARFVVK